MKQDIDITQLLQMAAANQQNQHKDTITYWHFLSLTLVALKATGFINVAWFWAFFPLFVPYIILTVAGLIGYIASKFVK